MTDPSGDTGAELIADTSEPHTSEPLADGELLSRLRVIEQQPLEERATAFGAVHDALTRTLESGHAEPHRPHG